LQLEFDNKNPIIVGSGPSAAIVAEFLVSNGLTPTIFDAHSNENIDEESIIPMLQLMKDYPDKCYGMMGLHPCSVKENVDFDRFSFFVRSKANESLLNIALIRKVELLCFSIN
jgi:hypothetical protein